MNPAVEIKIGQGLHHDERTSYKYATRAQKSIRRLGSVVELPKILHFQGGFQDAEGILTTQMLVAAIILSIVVTLHTGTFSHDALVAGDLRHAAFDVARGKELEEDSYERFVSGRLFVDGYIAVSCSAYSLLSAGAIYVSLIFSGARSDNALFQRWWRFGRVCILLSYVTLLVSIFYFMRLNHDSVYLVYPKYNWNTVLNATSSADSARLLSAIPRSLGAARGSSAAGTSVGQEPGAADEGSFGSVVTGERRQYGYDVAEMSKNFKLGMNFALGLTAVFLAIGHTWITWCREDVHAHDDESSSQVPEKAVTGTSAVEYLAEQSKLLKAQNELMLQFLQRQLPVASGLLVNGSVGDVGTKSGRIGGYLAVAAPLDIESQRYNTKSTGVPTTTCPSTTSTFKEVTSQISEPSTWRPASHV